jgi:outer membrane protein with beta-barrel domain
MMKSRFEHVALAMIMTVAPAWAGPSGSFPTSKGSVEITPFYGYRFGGDISDVENARDVKVAEGSSYGLMLDIQVEPGAFVELRYSRQSSELKASDSVYGAGQVDVTDIDVDHYMLGGTYEPETSHPVRPFVSADVGVVHFSPQGFDGETRFAFGLGGGFKLPIANHFGLRFDGRWVATRLSGSTDIYCNSSGSCLVVSEGTFVNQFEFTAGLNFRF